MRCDVIVGVSSIHFRNREIDVIKCKKNALMSDKNKLTC